MRRAMVGLPPPGLFLTRHFPYKPHQARRVWRLRIFPESIVLFVADLERLEHACR
jgi:hypothetical protein